MDPRGLPNLEVGTLGRLISSKEAINFQSRIRRLMIPRPSCQQLINKPLKDNSNYVYLFYGLLLTPIRRPRGILYREIKNYFMAELPPVAHCNFLAYSDQKTSSKLFLPSSPPKKMLFQRVLVTRLVSLISFGFASSARICPRFYYPVIALFCHWNWRTSRVHLEGPTLRKTQIS